MRTVLRNRDFVLLWVGQAVSGLGTWVNFVGLNLYVLHLFGSGRILGAFLFARMVPSLFFGPLGGWLADRYPRRTIMVIGDAARAMLVLGFLATTSLPALFALGVVVSAIDKVCSAAQQAFLPNLVERAELMDAVALTRTTQSVTMVLGPAAGASLVAAWGYSSVFVVDAATFVVSALCTLAISVAGAARPAAAPPRSPFAEFGMVAAFFRTRTALLYLAVIRLIDALGSGSYNTALPIFAKLLPVAGAYGWIYGAWAMGQGVGALVTARGAAWFANRREGAFAAAVVLMALGMGGTYHAPTMAWAMAVIFVGGFGDGISSVLFNTALAAETPDESRGKVFGTFTALMFTAIAVGMAGAGFLVDLVPLRLVTDGCSVFIAVGTVLGYGWFALTGRRTGA